jgi:tetratricopeptide (TPR) repeat protein/DNA-binding SARP family transcriptional activator
MLYEAFRVRREVTLYSVLVNNSGVQCSMQLVTFGKVGLSSCDFSRPKPLLLLSYVTLEGPQERRRLADLFWIDTATQNELPKKLGKLSVVLAQFKKEGVTVFPDTPGVDPLPSLVTCDALEFLSALENNNFKKALTLYQAPFLHDLGKPLDSLEVSNDVLEWVLEKREYFAEKARAVMLQLAEDAHTAGKIKEATRWAEKAYSLSEAPEMEPAQLSRIQHLLRSTKSDVTKKVDKAVKASLDEVSIEARDVFLALSLQKSPHLAVIREALKLSIDVLSQAREELLLSGLVDAESHVLATDMANDWLKAHPAERIPLFMKVVRATPANEAFDLYQSIYRETKGFGGIGDLQKARKAYYLEAKLRMDAKEFATTIETLAELREVENLYEGEPDAQCRFLEAYALERLGRFKEAFEVLQTLPEASSTPDITSLQSVLLFRLGKSKEARAVAEAVIQNGPESLWARANAINNLGNLELSSGALLEAASQFKKAATLFRAAGDKDRWVGSLTNYAVVFSQMAGAAREDGEPRFVVEGKCADAIRAYHEALEALDQGEDSPQLRAHILFNLGSLWSHQHDWKQAEAYYLQATPLAEQVAILDLAAHLHLNLGHVYRSQQQLAQTRASFAKAIDTAAKAGEPFIQAMAIAHLADLNNDPDAMEIGLELLEQSGHIGDDLEHFLDIYETTLKRLLEQSRLHKDPSKERLYSSRLTSLRQRNLRESEAFQVETTLTSTGKPTQVN